MAIARKMFLSVSSRAGLPDWSKAKLMTGTSYIAPSDGYINVQPVGSGRYSIINNVVVAYAAQDCGGDMIFIPVSKGDKYILSTSQNTSNAVIIENNTRFNIRRFIPFK